MYKIMIYKEQTSPPPGFFFTIATTSGGWDYLRDSESGDPVEFTEVSEAVDFIQDRLKLGEVSLPDVKLIQEYPLNLSLSVVT